MQKVLFVCSHSRHELLEQSILSILDAKEHESWKKIHVHQTGHPLTTQVFEKYSSFFDVNLKFEPNFSEALPNINFSRVSGYTIAFDLMGADVAIGIEEDTLVANDIFIFSSHVLDRFRKSKNFRGINFGSIEPASSNSPGGYSLLRFGVQGQAGLITRRTWKSFNKQKLLNFEIGQGWDSTIEFDVKTGFMVTPNASRLLDQGWQGGAHAPRDRNSPHYIQMRESWVGGKKFESLEYRQVQIPHSWQRSVSIEYKRRFNLLFCLRKYSLPYKVFRLVRSLIPASFERALGLNNKP
jgi:hypothetical protein